MFRNTIMFENVKKFMKRTALYKIIKLVLKIEIFEFMKVKNHSIE